MPRPRNVLIPSIMLAIASGYRRIIITGADHSWMKTISVTDDNEVVSVQPHFYAESDSEQKRIRHDYSNRPLHDVVESFAVAFRSYHEIASYARKLGVEILNATPGVSSMPSRERSYKRAQTLRGRLLIRQRPLLAKRPLSLVF